MQNCRVGVVRDPLLRKASASLPEHANGVCPLSKTVGKTANREWSPIKRVYRCRASRESASSSYSAGSLNLPQGVTEEDR